MIVYDYAMSKQQKSKKRPFFLRKWFLWTVGSIIGVIVVILLAFRLSPWPGALIIRAVFNNGSHKVLLALEKHTPPIEITTIANQQYRAGDPNAFVDVYSPTNATKPLPTIIWTHGGAWLSGDKTNAAPYYKLLAAEGFTVVATNYSLAPESTYPTAVFELNDMHRYIQANANRLHIDSNQITLAGDSAGSQLSSQMAAIVTNPDYAKQMKIKPALQPAQLKGVVLNCGIYQMAGLTQPDPTLPKIFGWGDDVSVWALTGTKDFTHDPDIRQMSAYFHANSHFPATFITGGNADPLTLAQSVPFAALLKSLDVPVAELFYPVDHQPALPHEYQFNLDNADGQNAFAAIITFVKAHTQ